MSEPNTKFEFWIRHQILKMSEPNTKFEIEINEEQKQIIQAIAEESETSFESVVQTIFDMAFDVKVWEY